MFFSEDQIEKYLLCQKCKKKFDEPIVLQCGKIICSLCVLDLTKKTPLETQFECICFKSHEKQDSFPTCELLKQLIDEKSLKISRGRTAEILEANLSLIEKLLDEFSFTLNHKEDIFREHCVQLRNQVQLSAEILNEKIETSRLLMMDQIDKYEQETLTDLKKRKNDEAQSQIDFSLLNEMNSFLKNWRVYLKNEKLNESDMDEANRLSAKLNEKILERKNFIKKLDTYRMLEFTPGESNFEATSALGNLSFFYSEKIVYSAEDFLFMKDLIDFANEIRINFAYLKNGHCVFAFPTENYFKLIQLDLKKRKFVAESRFFEFKLFMHFLIHENFLVVNYLEKDCSGKKYFRLHILNQNLEIIRSTKLRKETKLAGVCKKYILCMSDDEDERVQLFDWNLQRQETLGHSTNPNSAFYFAKDVKQLNYKDGKFILIFEQYVTIMNAANGSHIVRIDMWNAKLDSKFNLIHWPKERDEMQIYDLNGQQLRVIKLEKFPKDYCLVGENLGNFIFSDKKNTQIYESSNNILAFLY